MTKKLLLTLGASAVLSAGAGAQGLLSIGQTGGVDDFESRLPFTTTLGVDFGWDSNIRNQPDGPTKRDAAYTRAGANIAYANGSRVTNFSITAAVSALYWFDKPFKDMEDVEWSARTGFNLFHKVNRRLTLGNNFYIAYEIEPDNAIGASASRRLQHYLYGYNSAWASYAWTRRFSTVTRYTFVGIDYDDDALGARGEDRITHTLSQELRYVLTKLTTLTGEYRFAATDYDKAGNDYYSHYALIGADHSFSRDLRGTLKVGAQYLDYDIDNGRGGWKPYGEASLRRNVTDRSTLVWFNRLGYNDSELYVGGGADSHYSFQSSLSAQHQFTERLRGNAGLTYAYSKYDNTVLLGDVNENAVSLSLGLGYRIFSNTDLNVGYSFNFNDSDSPFREYDRHRVSAGMSVTF